MEEGDLPQLQAWLGQPHVARWWTPDTTAEAQVSLYRQRISGEEPLTRMLVASEGGTPFGWCQWYRWGDYPDAALAMDALDGEIGIDYAIGDPERVGRGIGTGLIAAVLDEVWRHHPGAGVLVGPDATNLASRRVLEKNGFALVVVRPVASEPTDEPMAIYRLAAGDV